MRYQFQKHYSLEEASALLPQITQWIEELLELRSVLDKLDPFLSERGVDLGGSKVNERTRSIARFQTILREFGRREILLKDLDRGLVDFPHLRAGCEVFLCWENGEEAIGYWHDLDSGYAGREPL